MLSFFCMLWCHRSLWEILILYCTNSVDDDGWYRIHVWLGQIGFIKFVILPYFKVMSEVLPAVLPLVQMVDMQQNYVWCILPLTCGPYFLLAVFYINNPQNHFLEVDMKIHKRKGIKSFLGSHFLMLICAKRGAGKLLWYWSLHQVEANLHRWQSLEKRRPAVFTAGPEPSGSACEGWTFLVGILKKCYFTFTVILFEHNQLPWRFFLQLTWTWCI